jgi:tetratricopeptide (TPR) repeat protein
MIKPKIFIGSSVEGLNIAYAVQQNLTHDAEITVWNQGAFELSQTTIESLVTVLEKSDFAIFVFSPDDIIRIRKKQFQTARDNVVFELGMFIGKLGRNRSFIIMPDKPAFHIPTDLLGITAGKYDTSRTDGNYQSATGPVCNQIRQQIKKLGLLQNVSNEASSEQESPENEEKEKAKESSWWSCYHEKKYDKAIELVQNNIETETDLKKKEELLFWKIYFEYKIDPRKGKEIIITKLRDEPDNKSTYSDMTLILLWEDDTELTEKIINEGLAKFEKGEVLISRKSEYLGKVGKIDEAITIIKETNYSENESLSIKLAELYENLEVKKTEDAFLVIKNAYIKNPSSKQLTYKLARLAQDIDKPKLALYLFDKLTNSYLSTIEYWGYLGNTCLTLELNNRAMIAYKKAEELSDPKQSWILSNIGNLLKNQGFYAEARKYFNQSLAIEPNSEYSFNRVATIIKSEQEESEKYTKLLKEGLALITEHPALPAPNI